VRPTSQEPLSTGELFTVAALAAALGSGGCLWLTSGLGTLLAGHGWQPVDSHDLATVVSALPDTLPDLRGSYPTATRELLPPNPVLWLLLLLIVGLAVAAAMAALRITARTGTPSSRQGRGGRRRPAGMASLAEIRRSMSEQTVRSRATQARPSLTGRSYPTIAVGLSIGTDLYSRTGIWGSVEDSYLYLGPPRSGKGVHLVIPQALDAPGSLIVTSTRPDVLEATLRHRQQRGPVLAFDPQQLVADAPRLRWSPARGCTDPLIAINRARALAAGSGMAASNRDGEYWEQMTAAVLRTYLHAAALTDIPITDVLSWASRPADPTPVRILRQHPDAAPGWAEELAAQSLADPRQRDSVWSGVRRAVDCLADPRVADACSPNKDEQFAPTAFLESAGTLYLLGATGVQLSVAPLITALLEDILDTARAIAATRPHGRLDPPLLLLLDEAANIAPIPTLPNLLADGGGCGITTVAVLQSLAQARGRWGEPGADAMWDRATTKVVLGGLAHAEDLHRISRLAGDIDMPLITKSSGAGGSSRSVSTQRLPVLPLDKIRCLPAGEALVLARRTPPVHVRLRPYWQHPKLRAAAATGDIAPSSAAEPSSAEPEATTPVTDPSATKENPDEPLAH
jgi:hypothetical protein